MRLAEGEAPHRVMFRMPEDDAFSYTMLERTEDGTWSLRWTAHFERARDP